MLVCYTNNIHLPVQQLIVVIVSSTTERDTNTKEREASVSPLSSQKDKAKLPYPDRKTKPRTTPTKVSVLY